MRQRERALILMLFALVRLHHVIQRVANWCQTLSYGLNHIHLCHNFINKCTIALHLNTQHSSNWVCQSEGSSETIFHWAFKFWPELGRIQQSKWQQKKNTTTTLTSSVEGYIVNGKVTLCVPTTYIHSLDELVHKSVQLLIAAKFNQCVKLCC